MLDKNNMEGILKVPDKKRFSSGFQIPKGLLQASLNDPDLEIPNDKTHPKASSLSKSQESKPNITSVLESKFLIPPTLNPSANSLDLNNLSLDLYDNLINSYTIELANDIFLDIVFGNSNVYFERLWEEILSSNIEESLKLSKPLITHTDGSNLSPQKEMVLTKIQKAEAELKIKKQLNLELESRVNLLKEKIDQKEKEVASVENEYNEYEDKINEISENYANVLVPLFQIKEQEISKIIGSEALIHQLAKMRAKSANDKEFLAKQAKELEVKKKEYDEILEKIKGLEVSNEIYKSNIESLKDKNRGIHEEFLVACNKKEAQMKHLTGADEEIRKITEEICKIDKDIMKKELTSSARKKEYTELKRKVDDMIKNQEVLIRSATKSKLFTSIYEKTQDTTNKIGLFSLDNTRRIEKSVGNNWDTEDFGNMEEKENASPTSKSVMFKKLEGNNKEILMSSKARSSVKKEEGCRDRMQEINLFRQNDEDEEKNYDKTKGKGLKDIKISDYIPSRDMLDPIALGFVLALIVFVVIKSFG